MEFLLPHYFTSSVQTSTIDSCWVNFFFHSFHTCWCIGKTSGPPIEHSRYNFCLKITDNVKSCCECEAGGIELLPLCGIQDFRPSHLPCKWWCKYYSRTQVLAKNGKYQVHLGNPTYCTWWQYLLFMTAMVTRLGMDLYIITTGSVFVWLSAVSKVSWDPCQ